MTVKFGDKSTESIKIVRAIRQLLPCSRHNALTAQHHIPSIVLIPSDDGRQIWMAKRSAWEVALALLHITNLAMEAWSCPGRA